MKNVTTYPVTYISVSINKPPDEVYRYASNPENAPVWTGFIKSVAKEKVPGLQCQTWEELK